MSNQVKNLLLYLSVFLLAQISIASDPREELISNSAEQLNYLYDYNNLQYDTGGDDQWYIYFLGGTVNDLKHIKDETKTMGQNYLNGLNEQLSKINESSDTAVYVAFTLYEKEIITPLFPKDHNTLKMQQRYIEEYFDGSSTKEIEQFSIYTKEYREVLEKIYERSWLNNLKKKNVLLPFSMLTNRKIQNRAGEGTGKKTFNTYTLYAPEITPDFDKAAFKKLFNENYAILGATPIEQKMERLVGAIDDYFIYDKRPEVRPCESQLASDNYEELVSRLGKDDTWIQVIEENPCVLGEMYSAGDDWGLETQFEKDLAIFVCTPLYAAMAIPAGAIIGEVAFVEMAKLLVRRYGSKKVKDVSQAMAINLITQTAYNYYFGSDEVTTETDIDARWVLALSEIDKADLTKDAFVEAFELNTRSDLVLGCITNGMEMDFSNLEDTKFDVGNCINSVASQIVSKLLIDTSTGIGKKLYDLLKNDPARFETGLKKMLEDAGEEGQKAFRESWDEIAEAFELKGTLIGKRIETVHVKNSNYSKSWFDDLPDNLKKDIESNQAIRDLFEGATDAKKANLKDSWEVLANNPILRKRTKNLENIGRWLDDGIERQKFIDGISKSRSKQKLIDDIGLAKSELHVKVLIKDYDNIPGVTNGRYVSNSSNMASKTDMPFDWKREFDIDESIVETFSGKISPFELRKGETIYRVSPKGRQGGPYWTRTKPEKLEAIVGGTAVQPQWNNFEYIHQYTVPDGIKIKCWKGTTARQPVSQDVPSNYHLPGGSEQLYISYISDQDPNFYLLVKSTRAKW